MTNQSNPRKVTTEAKNPIKLSKKLQVSAQQESAREKKQHVLEIFTAGEHDRLHNENASDR